jgi:PiT family inorganic phosphate transporter
VAQRIVLGWLFTLPCAAATAAVAYAITDLFGNGATGPIVVTVLLAIGCFLLWRANKRQAVAPDETISEHPVFGEPVRPAVAA